MQNGLPTYEFHSSYGQPWWVSVKFEPSDIGKSSEELIDIVLDRLQTGSLEITQGPALHHQQRLYVSLPVDQSFSSDDWVTLAFVYAEYYKAEIVAGDVSIDSEFIFGSGQREPAFVDIL